MSNVKIYQLYFKDEQRQYLNPLFTPYDNTINLRPNDREYPLLKECYKLAIQEGLDLWGAVSWNYKFKFSSGELISDSYFLDHIKNNPGYDVYFFNPFTNHASITYNVWEQGQWCHPHMVTIVEKLLILTEQKLEVLKKPQTRSSIFWGSMCIGNKKFWDQYINYAENFFNTINNLDIYTKYLYNLSASYVDNSINYFSFIQERLMSSFLNQSTLRAMPFHMNEHIAEPYVIELNLLKEKNLWDEWLIKRQPYVERIYPGEKINWAKRWLDEIN